MRTVTRPERAAGRALRGTLIIAVLVAFFPLVIAAVIAAYILARFRGMPRAPEGLDFPASGPGDMGTMAEVMDVLEAIPFKAWLPGPLSTVMPMLVDALPSALSMTRITAGLLYPYPAAFKPIMLESRDGTPICGHLAMQPADTRRPALVLASGAYASKNSGWFLSLATRAFYRWGFHVLALDLRNLGDSGRFSDAPTSWGYRESDDVLAAAEYLESIELVSTVGACGIGMAASAALIAAGRSPADGPLRGGVVAVSPFADASDAVRRLSGRQGRAPGGTRRLLKRIGLFLKTLADGPRPFFNPRDYTREVSCQYYEVDESDLYRKASPLKTMSEIEVPCLLLHALDDAVAPADDSRALLEAAGENPMVAALVAPSGGHSLYGPSTRGWFHKVLEAFFSYWGEFEVGPYDLLGLAGIDSMDIHGNPNN